MNGRKKKDGTRIDRGTGLSAPSVRDGIRRAEKHGLLKVEEDKRDLARIKRFYSLIMEQTPQHKGKECLDPKKITSYEEKETLDRTWKDNNRKTTPEKTIEKIPLSPPSVGDGANGSSEESSMKRKQPAIFDYRASDALKKIVSSHIKVNGRYERKCWADYVRKMRTTDKIPKADIHRIIVWYADHIGEEFIPEVFSTAALRRKFPQLVAAMRRTERAAFVPKNVFSPDGKKVTHDNMYEEGNCENGIPRVWVTEDGRRFDGMMLYKVRKGCRECFGNGLPSQREVDEVLESLNAATGSVPADVVGRVG